MALQIKIESRISNGEYKLTVFFSTDDIEETIFRFENASKSFQRNSIVIETSNAVVLNQDTFMYINPKNNQLTEASISTGKVFKYEITGKIETTKDNVFLDLTTAGYILKKSETYFIYVRYDGQESNKERLSFLDS